MKIPSLAETYADPDLARHALIWGQPADAVLAQAGPAANITDQHELTSHLDRNVVPDSFEHRSIETLLGALPADRLLYTYGEGTTAWVIGNDKEDYRCDVLCRALDDEGYDSNLLREARALCRTRARWRARQIVRSDEILAHNAVMEAVLGTYLERVNLPELVQQHARPGQEAAVNKRLPKYGLIPLMASTGYNARGRVIEWEGREAIEAPGLEYDMWLDVPVGCAVTYEGRPQAIVGVAGNGKDEILVRQLQGVDVWKQDKDGEPSRANRGMTQFVSQTDWRRVMVGIAARLGEQLHMTSVGITSGKNARSLFYNRLSLEDAKRNYDDQAVRLGFTQGADGNWRQPTASLVAAA